MLFQHFRQRFQFFNAVSRAGRVGRRIDDEPFRFGRNRFFQIFGADLKSGFLFAGYENGRPLSDTDHIGIGDPVRRGNDDFVFRIDGRHNQVEQRAFTATVDGNFFWRIIQTVFTFQLVADRFAESERSRNGHILCFIAVKRVFRRVFDMIRCRKVRFADAQVDDVNTLRFQFFGFRRNGQRGGRFDC